MLLTATTVWDPQEAYPAQVHKAMRMIHTHPLRHAQTQSRATVRSTRWSESKLLLRVSAPQCFANIQNLTVNRRDIFTIGIDEATL